MSLHLTTIYTEYVVDIYDCIVDETDCGGKFLRYFARLYVSLCVIERSLVFHKPKLTYDFVVLQTKL